MEERGLVGIEARDENGEELGRISEVVTNERSGEVTHVLVERAGESLEVPIARLVLDPEADFATVGADASDDAPRDHAGDEAEPEGYAPAEALPGTDDHRHEGQFVTEPSDPSEAKPQEDLERESGEADGWEDEEFVPDSGYPRTDAYIDPETGEETVDPAEEGELSEEVAQYLDGTELEVVSVSGGTVELAGTAATDDEIRVAIEGLMSLDRVREVDSGAVSIG